MNRIQPVKGTRDFYPEEMRVRRWIEDRWRETALRFGFEEYDAPVLEPLELYTKKSGEEIEGQLYAFKDKGGRNIALRPEMTPSMARMIATRGSSLAKPVKWFSIPRLFRYERPQRGRFREFWQLNLDIVGVEGVEADAEIMAAGVEVLRACGLSAKDFVVRYSDRRLIDAVMGRLDIPTEIHLAAYAVLDRLLRVGKEKAKAGLMKVGLPPDISERLIAIVHLDLHEIASELGSNELESEIGRLNQLAEYLDAYKIATFCQFDATVVRGLSYYTGIVFEMYDRKGELRAICGGGRFDDLIRAAGGEDMPAVGFGLGEAVLAELLQVRKVVSTDLVEKGLLLIPLSAADHTYAIETATELRSSGLHVDLWLAEQTYSRALKRAQQARVHFAVLVSTVERVNNFVYVHDLAKGKKERVSREELVSWLANEDCG